jgi:hypothetical protein
MATVLEFCSLPLKFSDVPITNKEITIFVKCHDRMFTDVTVLDEQGQELFLGGGPGPSKSWSWRRQVKDTSGVPIFDLRHHGMGMKNLWTVESPDGYRMAELKHASSKHRSDLDMVVANGKGKEDDADVMLQVRQKDNSGITTRVFFQNACIAELQLEESNDISDLSEVDRSAWKVRVAGGVDPAVVSPLGSDSDQEEVKANLEPRSWP